MRPHLTPRKYILRLTSKIRNTPNNSIVNTRILTYNILVCIADLSVLCGSWITIPCSALLAQCRVVHRYVLEFLNEYFTILIFLAQVQNTIPLYFPFIFQLIDEYNKSKISIILKICITGFSLRNTPRTFTSRKYLILCVLAKIQAEQDLRYTSYKTSITGFYLTNFYSNAIFLSINNIPYTSILILYTITKS